MENTKHLVAHFMAAGAEQRLDDYHFLRSTYETISGQETQLNRILRMLNEDEFVLDWYIDTTPIWRGRARTLYDFDRTGDTIVLPGSIAYQRLREKEQEDFKKRPSSYSPSHRVHEYRERRKRLSEQRDYSPWSKSDDGDNNNNNKTSSASRLRTTDEYDIESEESDRKRQQQARENLNYLRSNQQEDDNDKSEDIELISFTVRFEDVPSSTPNSSGQGSSLGRLLCEWISPSSSSRIDYYTIERQIGDQEWLPIGEKIDKLQNQTPLDVSSLISDVNDENIPSRFRLKAHLKNGKVFTSKPTDEISIGSTDKKCIIIPNVEILSDNSVQLTWKKDENKQANIYDIDKKKGNIYDIENKEANIYNTEDEEANMYVNKDKQAKTYDIDNKESNKYNIENKKGNMYDIEKKEENQTEWEKVMTVPFSQGSARIDNLIDAHQCQFRLVPSSLQNPMKSEDEAELDLLTVHNVNEWLSSLRLVPTSSNTVDVDISEEGFKEFDRYKVEYTTIDQLDQWKQMPDIGRDTSHLTIDNLEQDTDYKFRFTPVLRETTTGNESNSSQLSLVLDVKMPPSQKRRWIKDEVKTRVPPPQFAIYQIDATSALIVAIVPTDKPALFEDAFDIYSKKDTVNDDDWIKIGTIDKDHLSLTVKDLEENTGYAFKIHNETSPASDEENNIIQQFKFETASVKLYDPSLFLKKFEQSLENVVNGVMRAAAGHQALEVPVNISLNEVIKEIFLDETLVPNEQYGFDTLALTNDLLLFRGPKQMMLQELEIDETCESSKAYGEIIIHNYRQAQREQQPVIVREENGNTRIGNIDGDVIIRNVITDVLLTNEETRNQLSMNIVGQAFLKGFQGTLIASKFKGIIVVKTVNKL